MKAEEIRIGNKIKFMDDGTIFTVVCIDLNKAGIENTDEIAWIEFESLKPIPLTEEWLLKLGFRNSESIDFRWYKEWNGDIIIAYDVDDASLMISDTWQFGKRKYVHQLQNLYYALTGEELTIK